MSVPHNKTESDLLYCKQAVRFVDFLCKIVIFVLDFFVIFSAFGLFLHFGVNDLYILIYFLLLLVS